MHEGFTRFRDGDMPSILFPHVFLHACGRACPGTSCTGSQGNSMACDASSNASSGVAPILHAGGVEDKQGILIRFVSEERHLTNE